MKRILLLISVCAILIFTGCAENPDTTDTSINETTAIEDSTEKDEISDEEYLINLGKRLKLGMTDQEVIDEIGEPDADINGGAHYMIYRKGNSSLNITIANAKIIFAKVKNEETGEITIIYKTNHDDTQAEESN